jgi:hypothetical protein
MGARQKLVKELKAVGLATLFFAAWFGVLVLLKSLILAEYQVRFRGLSAALIGALIVAKVVLVAEHISLGAWVRRQPAVLDIILRTIVYAFGVLVAVLLERGFEARHEHGGFLAAVEYIVENRDVDHVWATTIGVTGALLVFNALGVLRRHLGGRGLAHVFLAPRSPGAVHEQSVLERTRRIDGRGPRHDDA